VTEIQEIEKMLKDHEKRISKLESSQTVSKPDKKQKTKGRKSRSDLLIMLKNENFFKDYKRISEIIERLSEKNYVVAHGDLTWALAKLVQDGELSRKRIEKKWAYKGA